MINIGLIGTGLMADEHAELFSQVKGCQLSGVYDIDQNKARAFADTHKVQNVYGSIMQIMQNPELDAICNVTPDRFHAEISIQAMKNGKHVLCEKPLAENNDDARKMSEVAKELELVNMVNFSYRNAAVIQHAKDLVTSGILGNIRHIEASYLQSWLCADYWGAWQDNPALLWRMSTRHGSRGVLGDIGVHILDFASYPVGKLKSIQCKMKTYEKSGKTTLGDYTLDANDSAVMTVEFQNGALGSIHISRWATGHLNRVSLKIFGDEGSLDIDLDRSSSEMLICKGADRNKGVFKKIKSKPVPTIHQRFIDGIRSGSNQQPDFNRGAYIQGLLEACFVSDQKNQCVSV